MPVGPTAEPVGLAAKLGITRQRAKLSDGDVGLQRGWYWWACHPGCMPDSDPDGPYATEREAIQAGQDCP
jgi:hypothetical protein